MAGNETADCRSPQELTRSRLKQSGTLAKRNAQGESRRINERFRVREAQVALQKKALLGFWKDSGVPSTIWDIGLGGLSFIAVNPKVKAGDKLRCAIYLPDKMPFYLTGELVHTKEHEGRSHLCGIAFTDYGIKAWSTLTELYNLHSAKKQTEN